MGIVSDMQSSRRIRLLIADDHQLLRVAVRALLQPNPELLVVGEAATGQAVVRLAAELQPEVILMDVSMPELNGIEATRQILLQQPGIRILPLSMHSERALVAAMVRAGAMGFITKECTAKELLNAIHEVLEGRLYFSASVTQQVRDEFVNPLPPGQEKQCATLSSRERVLLQLLAEGKNAKEIASQLHLSVKTVGFHQRRLMRLFHLHNMAELTKFAIREGLTSLDS